MRKKTNWKTSLKQTKKAQKSSSKERKRRAYLHRVYINHTCIHKSKISKRVFFYFRNINKNISKGKIATAPPHFCLLDNTELTLQFISQVKAFSGHTRRVHISLKKVTKLSHDAIALLLSVCDDLRKEQIKVSGTKPKHGSSKKILERSGFFKHMRGRVDEENRVTDNSILSKSRYSVMAEKTAPVVVGAMKTVHNEERRNKSLQRMLIELQANTINHAFPDQENTGWWLSVDHIPEQNKVSFVFVDNGVGILETVKLKFFKEFKQKIVAENNLDLLKDCFLGEVGSSTLLVNRGKGLPSIYNQYQKRVVSNLIVITNNVFLHFGSSKSVLLETPFEGTFYYWEIDQNCQIC